VRLNSAFRTQKSQDWSTPDAVYSALDQEFHFDADPCPLYGKPRFGELTPNPTHWGTVAFVNPPYNNIYRWLKAGLHNKEIFGITSVFLLPSRTGTRWFHDFANEATELRFIRGRLRFGGSQNSAPFDSLIMVFKR
jgi:hypothetical protein